MALYDAFISYNHAKDKPIASALQSVIQRLGKPWYRRPTLRVFRDDTSLSATPSLWHSIEQALGNSRFMILLASSEAVASQWVNKECSYWVDNKSADTLLIGVTSGTIAWDDSVNDFASQEKSALPPVLKGRFAAEPKWVDLTAYRDGADKRDTKFTGLAADFAAAIRGLPKEDLLSEEVRQQRRALRQAFSVAVLLLALAVSATAAGVMAYRAQKEAVKQRDDAERRYALAVDASLDLMIVLATVQQRRDPRPFYEILTDLKLDNAIFQRLLGETRDQERRRLNCQKAERLINLASTNSELRQIVQSFDQPDMIQSWRDAALRLQAGEARQPCNALDINTVASTPPTR